MCQLRLPSVRMCCMIFENMIAFRLNVCGEKQILMCLILMVFWYLYLLLKLQEKKAVNYCSECRIVGIKSFKEYVNEEDSVDDFVFMTYETPKYAKQIDMRDNGSSALHHDQFVLRGLTELSSIRKSINNIFFVESSCVLDLSKQDNYSVRFTLEAQHACGVESTARANPDRPVYVLHSCPLAEDFALRVPEYARALLELHNVFIVALDLAELSKGWSDPLPFSSTSLGLLALWQFGGTYCDLDTLALRPLHPLGTNYCGYREDNLLVGDQVLNFEPQGYGHTVVTQLLNTLSNGFERGVWKEDESFLTKVVEERCSQLPKSKEDCNKLTIYDKTVLFTAGLKDVKLSLSENFFYEFIDRIKMTAYTIHHFSRLYSISKDKDRLAHGFTLAKEFCPGVYRRFDHKL